MGRHFFPALLCGLAAGLVGLLLAGPHDLLLHRHGTNFAPAGDLAQALSGALAFSADDWRFPLLNVEGLSAAAKTSIIFTDSIPFYAILWKLAGIGRESIFRDYIPIFITMNFLLQGIAAAFALRWLDVRHAGALFAGALLFVFWPSFLFRFAMEHLALTSHWTVIAAIGLFLFPRPWGDRANTHLAGWCALTGLALLTHVYLAAMVGICFFARIIAELVQERQAGTMGSAASTALMRLVIYLVFCLSLGFVCGYLQGAGAGIGGYGFYSMNLAAPWIALDTSLFMPDWSGLPAGQIEGYTYIPLAVMGLIGFVAKRMLLKKPVWAAFPDNQGSWKVAGVMAFALTVFAVSNTLYWGEARLITVPLPDAVLHLAGIFRSSGRFFWPVSYMVLCLVIAAICRWLPGWRAAALLTCAAILVIIEMTPLRSRIEPRAGLYASDPAIQALFSGIDVVSVFPPYGCGDRAVDGAHHEIQLLAAKARALVRNSLVSARPANDCSLVGLSRMAPMPPPRELAVILGARYASTALQDAGVPAEYCRERHDLVFCLANWGDAADYLKNFAALVPNYLTLPVKLEFHHGANGTPYLMSGFSRPEDWGVWSIGDKSQIILALDPSSRSPHRLVVSVSGFIPPNRSKQDIQVTLASRQDSSSPWQVEQTRDLSLLPEETQNLVFERTGGPTSALRLTFSNLQSLSPYELGLGDDRRKLGIALHYVEVD